MKRAALSASGGPAAGLPRILTPSKAARLLGVHAATVVRWVKLGRMKSFRTVGGHRRILYSEVVRLLAGLTAPPA